MSLATRAPFGVWICALALLTAIAPLATDMYLPALPDVAAELGTTASNVQLTLTGFLVGLAAGQLIIGPLSDAWGRRRLLLAGTLLCLVASAACVAAPTVGVLVVARFLQGFGGAAGIVLSRAMIVDRTTGNQTVRLFSLMMAINGIAPVVAPLLGSGLLGAGSWRWIFVALSALTLLMAVGAFAAVPETLPPERRVRGGLRTTARDVRSALERPRYVGFTVAFALAFATMFTYISGSPFVLQDVLGLSSGAYALAFGANAAGLIGASIANGQLAGRVDPQRVLAVATGALVLLSVALLGIVLAGPSLWPVLAVLFLALTSLGFIMGNATALASREVRDVAGTGSALLGALQFALGAVVSPLVGSSPLVMAVVMVCASLLSLGTQVVVGRLRSTPAIV
ncbi:multidrug effflux MFS transporter [Pseudonocardia adelaidensis]|uniref:Multidrug effflux MFS transporter n=1 Tax=Pseudonocardia adelaidensis TaxID=648754 RepID=A0ABP9NPK0_9PSEU